MTTEVTHLFEANVAVGNILIESSASYRAMNYTVIDCSIG